MGVSKILGCRNDDRNSRPLPAEETQRGSETLRPLPDSTPNVAEAIENTARKYPEPISAALPPLCCGDIASKQTLKSTSRPPHCAAAEPGGWASSERLLLPNPRDTLI